MKSKTVILVLSILFLAFSEEARRVDPSNPFSTIPTRELLNRLETAVRAQRARIIDEFANRRDAALPTLREALSAGTENQKILVCRLLAAMRDVEAVVSLVEMTRIPDYKIKAYAVNALGQIGDRSAAPRLREILLQDNTHIGVTICALEAVGSLGSTSDVALIRKFLDNGPAPVRVIAAKALAMLGNPEVEAVLLQLSQNAEPFVQKAAVEGLGYLDSDLSRRRLQSILKAPSAGWKSYARIAIERQRIRARPTVSDRLEALLELTNDCNKRVAGWAIEEIADTGTPEADSILEEVSKGDGIKATKAERALKLRGRLVP